MSISHIIPTSCFGAAVFDRLCWQLAFGTFLPGRDGAESRRNRVRGYPRGFDCHREAGGLGGEQVWKCLWEMSQRSIRYILYVLDEQEKMDSNHLKIIKFHQKKCPEICD